LTTQYLEEADNLADNIIVIDAGKVIAEGTATQLKEQAGRASVVLTVTHESDLPRAEAMLRDHTAGVHLEPSARRITVQANGLPDMTRIAGLIDHADIAVDDLGLQRPSLDDVFLHLTGHRAEQSDDETTDDALPQEALR